MIVQILGQPQACPCGVVHCRCGCLSVSLCISLPRSRDPQRVRAWCRLRGDSRIVDGGPSASPLDEKLLILISSSSHVDALCSPSVQHGHESEAHGVPTAVRPISGERGTTMKENARLSITPNSFLRQVWALAKPYWFSEERWVARGLLA